MTFSFHLLFGIAVLPSAATLGLAANLQNSTIIPEGVDEQAFVTNSAGADSCGTEKIKFDPYIHKASYTIGVHATRGLDAALEEVEMALGDYLTATAGTKFDPPIEFNVIPYFFEGIFTAIENEEMDFFYANPGVYSCIGTQVGASALATVIKELETRGRTFDLDVYGGVIAVRHDNDDINTIADLKDKVIGAGAIIDLMGGQMQIYEMEKAGMSYVNDPKQVVFTKDQKDVVQGLISGRFDVGFIRTDQIELTRDEEGNLVDPDLFKIIEPKIYVMDSGELFPFLHSTDIFPEWPFAALPSVPGDVQAEVQNALLAFSHFAHVGELRSICLETNTAEYCDSLSPQDFDIDAACEVTNYLADLAEAAAHISKISGFRTARSYFELRSVQQEAGFLVQDHKGNWACTRPTNLYEGITCPEGHFKRHEDEFHSGCSEIGLSCNDNEEYDCFCKPCVEAFEVDVYHHIDGTEDPHLETYYGDSLPGCEKMSICGTIEQGESITLRIYDNLVRNGAQIEVVANAGDQRRTLELTEVPGSKGHGFEFTVTDKTVQVQVIDIIVDGEPISQSPIRVIVRDYDCEAEYGHGSHRVPDEEGNCVCAGNTYELGGSCLESAYFFLIIFSAVFIALGVLVFVYLGYKKQQSDSIWHINAEELHFNEPPEIIGQGGFGVVILGQYRGTKVAVKRVLPPVVARKGSTSLTSSGQLSTDSAEQVVGGASAEIPKTTTTTKKESKKSAMKKGKNVKFGENSGDIESQSFSQDKRGSTSASNRSWERLIMAHHSDNDILKILESATASDHGSGTLMASVTKSQSVLLRCLPMWARFDAHSRRVNEFVVEMRMLSRLRHPCITTVMGAVVSNKVDPMLVMEYMEYGSLYDLLHNETMTPGGEIILQVIRDIVQGIQFLHASKPPILHGDLKAKNILVDSRFRAKVADFGFSHFKTAKQRNILQGTPFYMAPEYLRRRSEYTQACDIYSLAMIIYEIYARQSPFDGEDPRKILPKVCHPRLNKRPNIPESMPPKMVELMKKCWSANAFFRPTAKDMDYVLVEMNSKDTEPLETAKDAIAKNMKRKPTSLYDVFPKHIADALNAGKKVEAESHETVTIVFSDIVGFTTISQKFSPMKVSTMLDRLYQAFDNLANKYHIFKVETIGDAYMGVTNLDGSEFETHAKQCAEYAQDAIRAASKILIDEDDPSLGCVQIRVGINSGPVVSNVIGSLNPRYGLFGDTVNTASRMESNSMPGKVHCSFSTAQLLIQQAPDIPLKLRGMINVKGKGKMKTYWVGDDNLVEGPVPPPMMPTDEVSLEPVTEREEDDPTLTEREEDDVSPAPTDDYHLAENDPTKTTKDCPAKLVLEKQDSGENNSHATHSTHISTGSSHSQHSFSTSNKDHFVEVHCRDEMGTHQAQIQMDGSVRKIAPQYSCDTTISEVTTTGDVNEVQEHLAEQLRELSDLYAC